MCSILRIVVPSSAGENLSVSPSVIEETVKLDAGGGVGGEGVDGPSDPQPAQMRVTASARRIRDRRCTRGVNGTFRPAS
jgi:hypothetical protein